MSIPRCVLVLGACLLCLRPAYGADQLIQVYLADKGQGQKVRLWLPEGVPVIRGLIIDLGNPHGGDRPDFQAFARANHFATLGTLLRWPATLKDDLVGIVADLAQRSGHPEVVNAPWIMAGFSRSVPQCAKVAMSEPNRILAIIAGGSTPDTKSEKAMNTWKSVPVMNVNGSLDPYVHSPEGVAELRWFTRDWPQIRDRNITWGAAIQWGAAHTPGTGFIMQAAFLKDELAVRMPAGWEPSQGQPTLQPGIPESAGWLGDVATWETPYPTITPAPVFTGDRRTALWMPGRYSAQVWRSYVVKNPAIAISVEQGKARLSATTAVVTRVEWFDGDQSLGVTDAATALALPSGLRCLFAEAEIGGQKVISRPLLIVDGAVVPLGEEPLRPTQTPLALIDVDSAAKAVLTVLIQRAEYTGPARWKPVYRSDFTTATAPWTVGALPGKLSVADGALQLQSPGQFLVALPFEWPSDLAIEYTCRSSGEKPNDIGLMMGGIDQGERPWRDGIMFHFGESGNARSSFQIAGETERVYEAKFVPGQWHRVRVERIGSRLAAHVDGVAAGLPLDLTENHLLGIKGRRLGFYTVANTVDIKDIVVSVREPTDLTAVTPALPTAEQLTALTRSLVTLADGPYAEQRRLGSEMLSRFSVELLATLRELRSRADLNAKAAARIDQLMRLIPPQ